MLNSMLTYIFVTVSLLSNLDANLKIVE